MLSPQVGYRTLEEAFAFALYLQYVESSDVEQTTQEHDIEEDEEKEEEWVNEESEEIQDRHLIEDKQLQIQ